MLFTVGTKIKSLADIKTDDFNFKTIQNDYKNEILEQKKLEANKILLKMKRDLLAISSTIISDKNLESNNNYKHIKLQLDVLSKYMYAQIEYIQLACEYENTNQAQKVIDSLLSCEYARTKYNIDSDYEFWIDHSIYRCDGADEQLKRLNSIHNSELSQKTAILFVDSLEYSTIRNNNWGRNYCCSFIPNDLSSNQDLGYAREKFRKDRNNSLKKLYEIFEFVNSLVDILMSSYVIETYNKDLAISYNLDRLSHVIIRKEANDYQKKLKKCSNSSCWI